MADTFAVNSKADLARLIGIMHQVAPHRVPLLEAVYHGAIDLVEVQRDAPFPASRLKQLRRPVVILAGDDDYANSGPGGWICRPRLAGWARFAIVHGTGAEVEHYRAAVLIACEVRRLVLVETGTVHAPMWHRLFARAGVRTLNLVTREGGFQPMPLPKEAVQ